MLTCYYEKIDVQKIKINQIKNLFVRRKKCDLNKITTINRNQATYTIIKQNSLNQSKNAENETVILQDESLDMRSKEYANCSHHEDTPIYLLKKSMLKNPIFNEEIEVLTNYDYEKELEDLDDYFIPDLIVIKQELLLLLYLINESKQSFIHYFNQMDIDVLNAIYFDNLIDALNVDFDCLNRNHQNLITSQFNLRCMLIYLQQIELSNSSTLDLTRNVLKKATNLGHSYEIHCFIAELVIIYIESLFNEIYNGKLNIVEYDFLECEKYLFAKPIPNNSPVQQRLNLRSRIKPRAPKKRSNFKMEEIKDYILEKYDTNCQKNSVKLNFTESDEEENDEDKDKENLRKRINRLKSRKNDVIENNLIKIEKDSNDLKLKQATKLSQQSSTLKERKANILNNNNRNQFQNDLNDLNDLNNLNNRIGNLCLDDTFDQEMYEFLIDESNGDYYDEFRKLLYKVLEQFGNYPCIKHYNAINGLLFRLSICEASNYCDEKAYYFSEICQANALRYKTIQHLQKKCKYVPVKYDSRVLKFDNQFESKNDEIKKMIDILPRDWRIVQIQFIKGFNSQSDLFLARYQRDTKPILLKINVNSEKVSNSFKIIIDLIHLIQLVY